MRPPLLVGLVALALASAGVSTSMAQEGPHGPPPSSSTPRVPPARPDSDLLEIRNIFRYADEVGAQLDSPRGPGDGGVDAPRVEAPAPPGARIVGLVERSGGLVAALSIEGEVLLLGEGASARGFTVLEISEEAVRLRGPDGEEATLRLP